jgi:glutathione S-transferase
MKFYDCKTAPSPRRVRMFLAEKGLAIETIQVDLRAGEHLGAAFRAINPYCTVPVLALDDGARLFSTAGIWRYLEARFPDPPLMGASPAEQGRVADLQWRIECDFFLAVAEALRNSAPGMKGRAVTGAASVDQIPALAERGRARVGRFLDGIDDFVGDGPFLAGQRLSVADIDLFIGVEFAKWIKLEMPAGAARARRWHAAMAARPSAAA